MKQEFDKLNAVILGCSADSVESQAKFKAKQKLNFPLLSDPDFTVIEAYGARRMKSFLGKSYLGIVRSTVLDRPRRQSGKNLVDGQIQGPCRGSSRSAEVASVEWRRLQPVGFHQTFQADNTRLPRAARKY